MMYVRLALEEDVDAICEMAQLNISETRPDLEYDDARCRATFQSYLDAAEPTFFVAERDREVIGFVMGSIYEYRAATGIFCTQEVLFVRPEHRGTRAAVLLMKQLVKWADQLGARECLGGNDNSFNSDRTARFLEHFDFERVGYSMRRVAANGRG